jgi:cytochrome c-type biogenesis protein CcmF
MRLLGSAMLAAALLTAAGGALVSAVGARRGDPTLQALGRRCTLLLLAEVTLAFVILEVAFGRSDFSYATVAAHSSLETPFAYRLSAAWSSQEGSLLLWLWLLSAWTALSVRLAYRGLGEVAAYAQAVLLCFGAFFAGLLVLLASPFSALGTPPADGVGLDPLLRYPSMMIHPPLLYAGYTLFTVPFAFALGALAAGRLDASWLRATRRFSLGAWICLTAGIVLGARWSYAELGWGGYWAWDPVENASLMPWLTGTAFIHSAMVQERRGMLRVWNVSLVLATGILALVGTFLVRSGILDSIHAFNASTLGIPFVTAIGISLAASIGLTAKRRVELRSEHRLQSALSREALFLVNNLLLIALCFVVFWGTFFPLISQALSGSKSAVGPPWFDRYTVPLAFALVLTMGLGQLAAWRGSSLGRLARWSRAPVLAAAAATAAAVLLGAAHQPWALAVWAASAFTVAGAIREVAAGAAARRRMLGESLSLGAVRTVARNRRRFGGFLAHSGVALLLAGAGFSSAFSTAREVTLRPGQTVRLGADLVRYSHPTWRVIRDPHGTGAILNLGAVLDVSRGKRHIATLRPSRGYFPAVGDGEGTVEQLIGGDATSEAGLRSTATGDLWSAVQPDLSKERPLFREADAIVPARRLDLAIVALAGIARHWAGSRGVAQFRIIHWPLVGWIWVGALLAILGGVLALVPRRRQAQSSPEYEQLVELRVDHALGRIGAAERDRTEQELFAAVLAARADVPCEAEPIRPTLRRR